MSMGVAAGAAPLDDAAKKAALEWLDDKCKLPDYYTDTWAPVAFLRTIKAMLAEPRLPAKVHLDCMPETTRYTMSEWDTVVDAIQFYHRALYAHLTKPATKTVWHVMEAQDAGRSPEHFDYDSLEDALGRVRVCAERHRITVTIEPREVPA